MKETKKIIHPPLYFNNETVKLTTFRETPCLSGR